MDQKNPIVAAYDVEAIRRDFPSCHDRFMASRSFISIMAHLRKSRKASSTLLRMLMRMNMPMCIAACIFFPMLQPILRKVARNGSSLSECRFR